MIGNVKNLLIIPHINIHNANALSSPFTIGFPAMTAWLGSTHALQRKLNQQGFPVNFLATGVVSHTADLQTYKGDRDFVHSIIGTGNPLDKTGARSAFIEEARIHLEISLVIEFDGVNVEQWDDLLSAINHLLHAKMKIASGDIKSFKMPFCLTCKEGDEQDLPKLQRALMPGYALIERRDLMLDAMAQGSDAIDALIDYLAVHNYSETNYSETDTQDKTVWHRTRKTFNGKSVGWVVPIATGFQGISELGQAKNQRDPETPHRFAESIITLGEFKMPHKLHSVEELLWRYHIDGDLYLCQQGIEGMGQNGSVITDDIESEF